MQMQIFKESKKIKCILLNYIKGILNDHYSHIQSVTVEFSYLVGKLAQTIVTSFVWLKNTPMIIDQF